MDNTDTRVTPGRQYDFAFWAGRHAAVRCLMASRPPDRYRFEQYFNWLRGWRFGFIDGQLPPDPDHGSDRVPELVYPDWVVIDNMFMRGFMVGSESARTYYEEFGLDRVLAELAREATRSGFEYRRSRAQHVAACLRGWRRYGALTVNRREGGKHYAGTLPIEVKPYVNLAARCEAGCGRPANSRQVVLRAGSLLEVDLCVAHAARYRSLELREAGSI